MPKSTPEGKEKIKLRAWLKEIGAYRFSPVQMGMGQPTLDELCCIGGRFVGIEVKAAGKKPTARQIRTMEAIRAAGGVTVWGDSFESIRDRLYVYFPRLP